MKLREASSGERKLGEYYGAYDFHFERIQNEPLKMLEIGIQSGGSLRMWEKYFPNAEIVGVDIDPHCDQHASERTKVIIGDQSDIGFLSNFKGYDIIIDDGGHTMHQQQTSFKELFNDMNPGGIYVIEDLHTSYWPDFWDNEVKTMDYLKDRIEDINLYGLKEQRSNFRQTDRVNRFGIESIHFHPSMAFIYKQ